MTVQIEVCSARLALVHNKFPSLKAINNVHTLAGCFELYVRVGSLRSLATVEHNTGHLALYIRIIVMKL